MIDALFNGQQAGSLAQSRGLQYGDGVFRTILAWQGKLLDWNLHLAKLQQDCETLSLDMPKADLLVEEVARLISGQPTAVIKIIVARRSGGRGYRAETSLSDRLLMVYPAPKYPATHWSRGVVGFRCRLSMAAQPALAGVKHLNRLEQVLASRDWPQDADEGILCNQQSQPVCGTRSNLFWVEDGRLHTPSLHQSGVAGIMRKKIMSLAEVSGIGTQVKAASWEDVMNADEAFVCNALIGIWPLRRLAGREWDAPGAMTRQLALALCHPELT